MILEQGPIANPGAAGRHQGAPLADGLLDWVERAPEKHHCREHDAGGRRAGDHEKRSDAEHERLHCKPQKLDQACHAARTVARGNVTVEGLIPVSAPSPDQSLGHSHRTNDIGIPEAHVREVVAPGCRLLRLGQRLPDQPLIQKREHDEHDDATGREIAEARMEKEDHADVDRRPGQVE